MGPIIYPSDKKHKYVRPLTAGHQEVVDILLSISSEKPAALLLSSAKVIQQVIQVIQVIQQLVAIGKLRQNSSHANKKN